MPVMLDWVGARGIRWTSDEVFNGGTVLSLSPDGVIEYRTERRMVVEGSHSANITIRGGGGRIEVSGNPAKFLQGHNLFGSADLKPLMVRALDVIAERLGHTPTTKDRASWVRGGYDLHRLDITGMIDCGTPQRVRKALNVLGQVARNKQQGALTDSGTVYIGHKSRRQKLKFYDKAAEIRKHPLPVTMSPDWHQKLSTWAVAKLRVELTLGSQWFHDNSEFRSARWWDDELPAQLLNARLESLEVSDTMRLDEDSVLNLPPKLVAIYDAWRAGRDLQALYSRPTFYRYRRQLLDAAGIDIAHVQPREIITETQYIGGEPMGALLRGPRVGVPEWARGTALLAS
jgi:II/X family phage/plasmid replication protein